MFSHGFHGLFAMFSTTCGFEILNKMKGMRSKVLEL